MLYCLSFSGSPPRVVECCALQKRGRMECSADDDRNGSTDIVAKVRPMERHVAVEFQDGCVAVVCVPSTQNPPPYDP